MNIPETFFSVNEELRLFGLSCLFGAAFGVIYDIFRTARLLLPHNGLLVAAEDIVFLMMYAVFLTSFAAAAARGELRFYYIIGNAAGFILYILTLGSIVIRTMEKVFSALKTIFRVVTCPFRRFFALLCKKAAAKFVGTSKNIVHIFKKIKMLLLKPVVLLYNKKVNKIRKKVDKGGKKKAKDQ